MKIKAKNRRLLLKAALGKIENDIVFINANVVNVFTGEILPAAVYVYDGFIAHIDYELTTKSTCACKQVIDVAGKYLIPGLIDAHMHIESSMLTPRNFAKVVIPHGTTTVITDPHEIANVFGVRGVTYMHNSGKDLPMRQLIDIPSCVPSLPEKECAGASFGKKEITELAKLERVIGLAEVMDYLGVIYGDDRMMDEIEVAEANNLYLQGHAPMASGRMLSAYLCGGPHMDHESATAKEALEKFRAGMYIDMRESSMAKNVIQIWEGLKDCKYLDTLCLCTDDRESEDLLKDGHINAVARLVMKCGMDPIDAIKCCTINSAREIKMDNLGAIAPGYVADLCILEDLREMKMQQVYFDGKLVAQSGQLVVDIPEYHDDIEEINSLNFKQLKKEDFIIYAPIKNGKVIVNCICYEAPFSAITHLEQIEMNVVEGVLQLPNEEFKFAAIVNRYGLDHITLAVIKGVGNTTGALASTVSHDSHNLTIVYDTAENALLCAETLRKCAGGLVTVDCGKVLACLPLAIGGLLSKLPVEETAILAEKLKEADRKIGLVKISNPILRIAVLALPVVPEVKLSDLGIIDVATKEFIPLFVS